MRKIEKDMNRAIRNRKEHWQSANTSVESFYCSVSDRVGSIVKLHGNKIAEVYACLLYTSPSPRDLGKSRMPSSA